jgi:TRAP transporter TAXI family solute receptor
MLAFSRLMALFASIGIAFASASAAGADTARISISTGGSGGVYYPLGGGMANVLSKYVPGLQATAEVTGGSVDNLKLIGVGKSEVGISMVDAAWDAAHGEDKFKNGKALSRAGD